MSHGKHPESVSERSDGVAGHEAPRAGASVSSGDIGTAPHKDRDDACCGCDQDWHSYHLTLDWYMDGPSRSCLKSDGGWGSLPVEVGVEAYRLRKLGLARWRDLDPSTRERLQTWSPVAEQLWESDFFRHREGLVRAWIWHYLQDNLFSFSAVATGPPDSLLECSSPVWERVRALHRDLTGKSLLSSIIHIPTSLLRTLCESKAPFPPQTATHPTDTPN